MTSKLRIAIAAALLGAGLTSAILGIELSFVSPPTAAAPKSPDEWVVRARQKLGAAWIGSNYQHLLSVTDPNTEKPLRDYLQKIGRQVIFLESASGLGGARVVVPGDLKMDLIDWNSKQGTQVVLIPDNNLQVKLTIDELQMLKDRRQQLIKLGVSTSPVIPVQSPRAEPTWIGDDYKGLVSVAEKNQDKKLLAYLQEIGTKGMFLESVPAAAGGVTVIVPGDLHMQWDWNSDDTQFVITGDGQRQVKLTVDQLHTLKDRWQKLVQLGVSTEQRRTESVYTESKTTEILSPRRQIQKYKRRY